MILYPETATDMRQVDGRMWNAVLTKKNYELEQALKDGANPNARWTGDDMNLARPTPLHYLLLNTRDQRDIYTAQDTRKTIKMLLDHGADPSVACDGEYAFQVVVKYDHPVATAAMFKKFLRGIDRAVIDREVSKGDLSLTPLAYAMRARSVSWVRDLMKMGADPWRMQDDGQPCWIYLLRSNSKSMDYHRHPQAAYLATEIAKQQGAEKVLQVIEREVDLLAAGSARQDSYGSHAMRRLCQWMTRQGGLDGAQAARLMACAGPHADVATQDLIKLVDDPNILDRKGRVMIWGAVEDGQENTFEALMGHPRIDLTVMSPSGETLADALRRDRDLDIEDHERSEWIAQVEQQLLSAQAPAQPQANVRRARL